MKRKFDPIDWIVPVLIVGIVTTAIIIIWTEGTISHKCTTFWNEYPADAYTHGWSSRDGCYVQEVFDEPPKVYMNDR